MTTSSSAFAYTAFSSPCGYAVGTAYILIGVRAYLRPVSEYTRIGLPLERAAHPRARAIIAKPELDSEPGVISPLVYTKAGRDVSYGLALIALQYQGNTAGVTTLTAILSLVVLGDGFVVRYRGGDELRHRAWSLWRECFVLGALAGWRLFLGYGEWAAFHALHI